MRKARIIATIGPASESPENLSEMLDAGVDVCRLNFSHGDHEWHQRTIKLIREIAASKARNIAILQDLQGLKIRTGKVYPDPVELVPGQRIRLTCEERVGDASEITVSYKELPHDTSIGDEILLSDGQIQLRVIGTREDAIDCEIEVGGPLASNQGVNVPGTSVSAPPLTDKDLEDLQMGIRAQVDYIALSFVQQPRDIQMLREVLRKHRAEIPVIAKLEKPSAIENLEEILAVADGVMVARGDLGVEMSPERVPMIQKRVITSANQRGKLVITATQMLDSMIRLPRPTRAEASDVANAVLDGTDAVMLSGETAAGKYPLKAVRMMARIVDQAETFPIRSAYLDQKEGLSFPQTVCISAYHASQSIRAKAIVAFTQSGSTAQMISKYRPPVPIFAVTPHVRIMRRLCLYPGVQAFRMHEIRNVDELILELESMLLDRELVQPGDNLIILTGAPIIEKGHTSLMKLHSVRDDSGPETEDD